jgi:CDGSH-type Zn-finger protein
MAKPDSPRSQPRVVVLKPGNYYWCACGRTRRPPYCDGSHKGSGISPVRHVQSVEGEVTLCGCQQSSTPPLCDDRHDDE